MLVILSNFDSFFLCYIIAMMDYASKTICLCKLFLMPLGTKFYRTWMYKWNIKSSCSISTSANKWQKWTRRKVLLVLRCICLFCFDNISYITTCISPSHLSSFKNHATSGKQGRRRWKRKEEVGISSLAAWLQNEQRAKASIVTVNRRLGIKG